MADSNVLIPSSNVEGNITSCKIEQQTLKKDKHYVYSLTEQTTYATYDVCSKQIIQTYTVPSFTPFGFVACIPLFILVLILIFGLFVFFAEKNDRRKGTYGVY
jgi:hypothetical protein